MKDKDIAVTEQTESSITNVVPQSMWEALRQPTPKKYIKKRQGPAGRTFDYVEAGYVKDLLNKTFNTWSFTVVDKQVGNSQIWVQGRLTVQIPVPQKDGTITFVELIKEQFGGASIKKSKTDGTPVDIGNDLKAATSDALKKCASEWGVASDIYWGLEDTTTDDDTHESVGTVVTAAREDHPTPKQIGYINKLMRDKDVPHAEVCDWFKVDSLNDLTYEQGQQCITRLINSDTKDAF